MVTEYIIAFANRLSDYRIRYIIVQLKFPIESVNYCLPNICFRVSMTVVMCSKGNMENCDCNGSS